MSYWKAKKDKLHTRTIEISSYEYEEQKLIVEGFLRDDRFQESRIITGERFTAGIIHHMSIRLLINCSNMVIEDIDTEFLSVPREICHETINCLASIKGLSIARGFTAKVKKIAGGNKGCTHLLELLLAMAPAAIQGYASYQSKRPQSPDPERSKMILQRSGSGD